MLGITHFSFFLLSCVALSVTPGPDSAFVVARSIAGGRKAGLASALGVATGCCVHLTATVLGLAAIIAASVEAFTIVKLVGAAYLVYLGVRMLFAKMPKPSREQSRERTELSGQHAELQANQTGAQLADQTGAQLAEQQIPNKQGRNDPVPNEPVLNAGLPFGEARSLRKVFVQGLTTNLLNPKVVLFFVAFFPQFVAPDAPQKSLAFLVLGLSFVVISTIWSAGLACAAGMLSKRVGASPRAKVLIDRVVGGVFVGLGVRLALIVR